MRKTSTARTAPLDLAVTITPCDRTPEWAALWRRLLAPIPTDPDDDTEPTAPHEDPAHLTAETDRRESEVGQ